jgi:uncharacterized protein (DUF1330 family)
VKDDDYFKEFGKSETPFGPHDRSYHRIEIVGKAKTYGLRNLSYKMLADKYRVYEKGFFPILKAHNGRFITYDDNVAVLEGTPEAGRTVVIQFESEAACMTWWNSPEYRELAAHRHAGTTTHSISIVHAIKK